MKRHTSMPIVPLARLSQQKRRQVEEEAPAGADSAPKKSNACDAKQIEEMVKDAGRAWARPMRGGSWSTGGRMGRLSSDELVRICKNVGVRGCCRLARTCKKMRGLSSQDDIWLFLWSQRHRMCTCIAMLAPAKAIGAPHDDDNPGAVAMWSKKKVKTNVKAAFAELHLTRDPLHVASCDKNQRPPTCKRRLGVERYCDSVNDSEAVQRCSIAGCGVVRCGKCLDLANELVTCQFCKAAFCPLHREVAPGIIGNCERFGSAGSGEAEGGRIFLCTDCRPEFRPHCKFRSAA